MRSAAIAVTFALTLAVACFTAVPTYAQTDLWVSAIT